MAESSVAIEKTKHESSVAIDKFFVYLSFTISALMVIYLFLLFLLPSFAFGAPLQVQPREVSVSELHVSDRKLTLKLSIEFSIHNPNEDLKVIIKSNQGTLYYKNIEPLAAETVLASFKLEAGGVAIGRLQFSSGDGSDGERPALIRSKVIENMSKDLRNGVVQFSLKMRMMGMYESGPFFWNSDSVFMCGGLNVEFNNRTGSGKLIQPAAKNCSVEQFRNVFF